MSASFGESEEDADEPLAPEPLNIAGAGAVAMLAGLPFAAIGGAVALAPLLWAAGLLSAAWPRLLGAVRRGGLALALAAAFFAWLAASCLWSLDANAALKLAPLAATALAGLLLVMGLGGLPPPSRVLAVRAGAAGLALLFALASLEAWFDFPVGRSLAPLEAPARHVAAPTTPAPAEIPAGTASGGESATDQPGDQQAAAPARAKADEAAKLVADAQRAVAIALMCVGGGFVLLGRLGFWGRLTGVALVGASISLSMAFGAANNAVALGCGALAAALALIWPRATVSILAQLIAGWIVVAPLVLPLLANLATHAFRPALGVETPFTWQARLESWTFMAEKIKERAFWGWGFGAAGHFAESYSLLGFTLPYVPRHPHSAPLQIWLETGAVGAMLAAGALASFGRRAGAALASDRFAAAGAASTLAIAAALANVSAGAWSLWWWTAAAVGAGLVRLSRRAA